MITLLLHCPLESGGKLGKEWLDSQEDFMHMMYVTLATGSTTLTIHVSCLWSSQEQPSSIRYLYMCHMCAIFSFKSK